MSSVAGNLTRSRRVSAAPPVRERPGAKDKGDDQTDGRRLRAARNRDSVVSAVLEIIREQGGGPLPGAAEVAVRAGVSERTVFRHFADLDSLFLAAASRQRPVIVTYLAPRPDFKEVDKRIAALVKLRSKLYEEIAPVRRVAVRLAAANAVLAEQVGEANKAARGQLATVFEPELSRAGSQRSTVLDQLELVTSWAAWEMMRTLQGSSADRARKVTTELLTAILKPLGSTRRSR
jgi:AcrR family transcriptional regulator